MKYSILTCAAVLLALSPLPAMSDSLMPPHDQIDCSRNSRYCLVRLLEITTSFSFGGDPKIRNTYPKSGLYRAPTAKSPKAELVWALQVTHVGVPLVLNDGKHVIDVAESAMLSRDSLSGTERVLAFFSRDAPFSFWVLSEVLPSWSSLRGERTASHYRYQWLCGWTLSEDEQTLEVTPCLGSKDKLIRFDTSTGKRR